MEAIVRGVDIQWGIITKTECRGHSVYFHYLYQKSCVSYSVQKQPREVFFKKCSKKLCKIHKFLLLSLKL